MGGAASSGAGMTSNPITRKAPIAPELGQVQQAPDHPTRNQGESVESSKRHEGGGKSAGGAFPLEPAATDRQLGPQVHTKAPKSKAKPKAEGKAKAAGAEKGRQTRLKF